MQDVLTLFRPAIEAGLDRILASKPEAQHNVALLELNGQFQRLLEEAPSSSAPVADLKVRATLPAVIDSAVAKRLQPD